LRCLDVAATGGGRRDIEKTNRGIERSRTQMHVPLRGSEIRVSSQFLNCSCRRATHRQVRTKRVTENVNPAMVQLRRSRRMVNVVCDDLFVQRLSIPIAKHEGVAKMS
jgi:hypothetical protein